LSLPVPPHSPQCSAQAATPNPKGIPVTILTGFLGAGKSTLVQHMLREAHGHRIAIIENEFGAENIDAEIIASTADERIVQLTNGCVCCSIRDDLREALVELATVRSSGRIAFDRVVIETTGLADPIPVAQTFFLDEAIAAHYRPDGIVTMVDGKFAMQQLDRQVEAQRQVGFADRLFLSKLDLVSEQERMALTERLIAMNGHARQVPVSFGDVALAEMFDIGGFDLIDTLELLSGANPDPCADAAGSGGCAHEGHTHSAHRHDAIESFSLRSERPLNAERIAQWLNALVSAYGDRLMRYKGVLNIAQADRKLILQGVHQLSSRGYGAAWPSDGPRVSKLVFIGRDLPRAVLERSFHHCMI
jgi:G3E family GTPase